MVNHGTLVKIIANHDTWNACQDHGKIMARSWQVLDKITMVCHDSYQGYCDYLGWPAVSFILDLGSISKMRS